MQGFLLALVYFAMRQIKNQLEPVALLKVVLD